MANVLTNPSQAAGGVNLLNRANGFFADPFEDLASQAMPRTMADAMRWCERIFTIDGTYRQAMDRVASYFITDIEVTAGTAGKRKTSRQDKEKFEEFLRKKLRIVFALHRIALDYLCYGNSFSSVVVPFRRYLACPSCHAYEAPFARVANTPSLEFRWVDFEFHARCPGCGYRGKFDHIDRAGEEEAEVRIKRWSPHEIEILHDSISDDKAYIWTIPERDRKPIKEGKHWHLERTPWEVIQAVKHGNKLMFDPGYIYHMCDPSLAGFDTGGWGLSKAVTNFRQAWYCQVLRRYNEAIVTDYIIPFRVITPEPKSGADGASADPVLGANLSQFKAQVRSMLKNRKRDPAAWNILPFPINYQALGGEAQQLAPFELIDQAIDQLLNAAGVPAELYKGSLSVQVAPAALRLFESHWSHLVDALNGFLEYLVDRIGKVLRWEPVDCKLVRVTTADDLNRQLAKLQLMAGRNISQTTGLASVGADFEQEQVRMLEEQQFVQDKTEEMQEAAQGAQAAAPPAGPAPPDPSAGAAAPPPAGGAAGGDSPSLTDLMSQSQQIAEQLAAMPDGERKSQLLALGKQSPTLHHLVIAQLDQIRRGDARQGQQAIGQQRQQQAQQAQQAGAPKMAGLATLINRRAGRAA